MRLGVRIADPVEAESDIKMGGTKIVCILSFSIIIYYIAGSFSLGGHSIQDRVSLEVTIFHEQQLVSYVVAGRRSNPMTIFVSSMLLYVDPPVVPTSNDVES
jgi:hypothetical protein